MLRRAARLTTRTSRGWKQPSSGRLGGRKFYTVIVRDVTDQHALESRLREQAALLDQARDAIQVCDLEDRILFWSRGAERLYGYMAS